MLVALAYLAALIGIAIAIVLLSDRIRNLIYRKRNPPEKEVAERARHLQRLSTPDWVFYERHLGRPVPSPLRELFAHPELLASSFALKGTDLVISQFEPLDAEGLIDSKTWLGIDIVPIASSDGDPIYLKPGATAGDAVYITYHDGGDTVELVSDVAMFVRQVREARAHAI